jgi:hypothetical protein
MVCYIYCKINDRELMISEDDPENIKIWVFSNRGKPITKPYWKQAKIATDKKKYKSMIINKKIYMIHRINYYAWNQDWDITFRQNNMIDHIDRNPSNNHISNLRIVTNQQNQYNTNPKGIYFRKDRNVWYSTLLVKGKKIFVGYFKKEEDARKAYLEAKKIYHII